MKHWLVMLLAGVASPLGAQSEPNDAAEDTRFQTIAWQPDQITPLAVPPGNRLTVMFSPGEKILNGSVAQREHFQVEMSSAADSLFITPVSQNARSRMTVQTDARSYAFELFTAPDVKPTYVVRFAHASEPQPAAAAPIERRPAGTWQMRGERNVQPARIQDDGVRTFIEFAPEQSMPAVFAVGPTGEEQVVDGYMRGEVFVIDRVHEKLVFRIDRDAATAARKRAAR